MIGWIAFSRERFETLWNTHKKLQVRQFFFEMSVTSIAAPKMVHDCMEVYDERKGRSRGLKRVVVITRSGVI